MGAPGRTHAERHECRPLPAGEFRAPAGWETGRCRMGEGRRSLPRRGMAANAEDLLAADGVSNVEIAELSGVSRPTVLAWRADFAARGLVDFGDVRSGLGRKPSTPPEKIVGLYLNPPDNAVVLCADEKSQIQALDRTQPSLPMKPGRAGTMTHDYKRNGTTTLF